MAQNETWLTHDLLDAVKVQYLDGNLFSMDNAGNLIGVTLTRDGEDYSGGGSVSANVIRSDGGTVAVIGALSGKTATVVLPQAAYAVPGVVSVVVKLTVSGQVTTIAAIVANVYRSSTDTAIDPGTIIPSIQSLISQINTAVASIPADYSALWTKLAPAFSTDASYVAGQYVTYNSGLWRFNTPHSGSWSSSDVTAVNLGGEIAALKSAINKNGSIDNDIIRQGISAEEVATMTTEGSYYLYIPAGILTNVYYSLCFTLSEESSVYITQNQTKSTLTILGTVFNGRLPAGDHSLFFKRETNAAWMRVEINSAVSTGLQIKLYNITEPYWKQTGLGMIGSVSSTDSYTDTTMTFSEGGTYFVVVNTVTDSSNAYFKLKDSNGNFHNTTKVTTPGIYSVVAESDCVAINAANFSATVWKSKTTFDENFFNTLGFKRIGYIKSTNNYTSNQFAFEQGKTYYVYVTSVTNTGSAFDLIDSNNNSHQHRNVDGAGLYKFVAESNYVAISTARFNGTVWEGIPVYGDFFDSLDFKQIGYVKGLNQYTTNTLPIVKGKTYYLYVTSVTNTGAAFSLIDSSSNEHQYQKVEGTGLYKFVAEADCVAISAARFSGILWEGVPIYGDFFDSLGFTRKGYISSTGSWSQTQMTFEQGKTYYVFATSLTNTSAGFSLVDSNSNSYQYMEINSPGLYSVTALRDYVAISTSRFNGVVWEGVPTFEPSNVIHIGSDYDYKTMKAGITAAYAGEDVTVYVHPGTYDLVTEFADEISAAEGFTGLPLGHGMHVIFYDGAKVTALFDNSESTYDAETWNWLEVHFQPFYAGIGDYILENANIEAKNTRYCVHDDRGHTGTVRHTYINCKMKYSNTNPSPRYVQCIGGGLAEHTSIEVNGGYYESHADYPWGEAAIEDSQAPITYHNGTDENSESTIFIKNVYLANLGRFIFYDNDVPTAITKVLVSGCSMGKATETVITEGSQLSLIEFCCDVRENA